MNQLADRQLAGVQLTLPDKCSISAADPNVWCGRALQEVWSICRFAVLHQCIRPLIGACVLRATMDISAHTFSLADRPRAGHLGHQVSHAP